MKIQNSIYKIGKLAALIIPIFVLLISVRQPVSVTLAQEGDDQVIATLLPPTGANQPTELATPEPTTIPLPADTPTQELTITPTLEEAPPELHQLAQALESGSFTDIAIQGFPTSSLSGMVLLQGRHDHSGTQILLTMEPCVSSITDPNVANVFDVFETITDTEGRFQVTITPGQTYECLYALHDNYFIGRQSLSEGNFGTLTLIGGDLNNDGIVSILDLSLVAKEYGINEANGTSTVADLNGDGVVNISDLSLVASNYDQRDPLLGEFAGSEMSNIAPLDLVDSAAIFSYELGEFFGAREVCTYGGYLVQFFLRKYKWFVQILIDFGIDILLSGPCLRKLDEIRADFTKVYYDFRVDGRRRLGNATSHVWPSYNFGWYLSQNFRSGLINVYSEKVLRKIYPGANIRGDWGIARFNSRGYQWVRLD